MRPAHQPELPGNVHGSQLPIIEYGPPSQSFMRWQKPRGVSETATDISTNPAGSSKSQTVYTSQSFASRSPSNVRPQSANASPDNAATLDSDHFSLPAAAIDREPLRPAAPDTSTAARQASENLARTTSNSLKSPVVYPTTGYPQHDQFAAPVAATIRAGSPAAQRPQETSSMTIRTAGIDADRAGEVETASGNPLRISRVIQASESSEESGEAFMVRPASATMSISRGNPLR